MAAVADRFVSRGGPTSRRRTFGPSARRIGLGAFFASIAVNAALGIYAVLTPDFGDSQRKILLTSLCVTGAVLLALACEPGWERRLLGPVPGAGAGLGAVAFAATIAGVWVEVESETFGRALGSTFTIAVACAAASLLALARLAPRHVWVFHVTLALLALGAGALALVYWLNDPDELYTRGMGVVLIALAAFAVTVPVLHWIDRSAHAVAEAAPGAVQFCPHCGKGLRGETGVALVCGECGRGFTITTPAD